MFGFQNQIGEYLTADLDGLMFANFLRTYRQYHRYFQFCRHCRGEAMFVRAEVLFAYEHGSDYRIADHTFDKLLEDVSSEDYSIYKYADRICCEQLMAFLRYEKIHICQEQDRDKLAAYLAAVMPDSAKFVKELYEFIHLEPRLPSGPAVQDDRNNSDIPAERLLPR